MDCFINLSPGQRYRIFVATKGFFETDVFLHIAGSAGGTGFGAISVLTWVLKKRCSDKLVWDMVGKPMPKYLPKKAINNANAIYLEL